MTIGTPGEMGDPPTHLTEPNDVLIAPNGNIFIGETHGAQFQHEPGPTAKSRITVWAPDGSFITSFGEWGVEDGQFRAPHSLSMDSQGRLFVADRGNNRIQIFTQDGEWLDTWYQFSRISGLHIDPTNDMLYAIDSESRFDHVWGEPFSMHGHLLGSPSDHLICDFNTGTISKS